MIKRKNTNTQIQTLTDKIVKEFKPEKIILFGSYAWGKPTNDSDIDLFIVKRSKTIRRERQRELHRKLIGNNFPPMDIIVYTPSELMERLNINDFFVKEIIENGTMLYEKK